MKKVVCFIPIKDNSTRVLKKNLRPFGRKPLFRYVVDTVIKSNKFDEVIVDTDSDEVKEYCRNNSIGIIDRDPELSKDSANGNDLLKSWIETKPNYDIYFQIFVTSPFLKVDTINDCVDFMKKTSEYDSIFTGAEEYTWYWFDNKPINYEPKVLPRSQDAKPMVRETTSLYGITKEAFLKDTSRVGRNPKIYIVNQIEAVDIDTELDFFIAEQVYWKNNLRR
tara:strand:+ start:26 stop:691 length:666 start_codon:yes stop_codon:yes gene_type:complete